MVVLRRKNYYVFYPEYFDKKISRKQGRRVSLENATEDATLAKLIHVCRKLKLNYEEEKEKAFPNNWWEQSGRVLVKIDKKNKIPKHELLKQIAENTRKLKVKKKDPVSRPEKRPKYKKQSTHSKKRSTYRQSGKKKKVSKE